MRTPRPPFSPSVYFFLRVFGGLISARRSLSSLLGPSHRASGVRAASERGTPGALLSPPAFTAAISRDDIVGENRGAAVMFIASIPAREAIARLFLALITRNARVRAAHERGHLSLARFARDSPTFFLFLPSRARLLATSPDFYAPTSLGDPDAGIALFFRGGLAASSPKRREITCRRAPFIPGEPSSEPRHAPPRDYRAQKGLASSPRTNYDGRGIDRTFRLSTHFSF